MDTKTPEQLQVIQQQQLAERQLQADAQAPKPSDMDAKTQAELQSIQQQQLAERLAQAPTNTGSANTTADAEAPATTRLVWGLAEYGATGDATEMKEAWNDIWNPKSTPDSVPKEFSPFDTSITAGAQYGFTPVPDLGAPPQVPQVPQTEPSAPAPQISQAEPAPIVVASNDPTVVPSTPEPTTPTAAPDATPAKTGNSDITASADDARLQPAPATPSAPIGETGYKGGSVANYLDSAHMDSSFAAREQLAAKYGITGYSGTTVQNTQLLKTLRGY